MTTYEIAKAIASGKGQLGINGINQNAYTVAFYKDPKRPLTLAEAEKCAGDEKCNNRSTLKEIISWSKTLN